VLPEWPCLGVASTDAAADFDRWKLSEKGVDRNAEETYLGTVSARPCRAKNILPNIRQ